MSKFMDLPLFQAGGDNLHALKGEYTNCPPIGEDQPSSKIFGTKKRKAPHKGHNPLSHADKGSQSGFLHGQMTSQRSYPTIPHRNTTSKGHNLVFYMEGHNPVFHIKLMTSQID